MTKNQVRTANFLRILRERYDDSPGKFEMATGYSANMVSQIKSGAKIVGEDRGATLEKHMKLEPGTLERVNNGSPLPPRAATSRPEWPLSVSQSDYESLSPRLQRELDEAFTRMVLGAQAQDLLQKQGKLKRG